MILHFSPLDYLVLLFFVAGQFWYVTLAVAAVIAFWGVFLPGWWRRALFGFAALLAIYVAIYWGVTGVNALRAREQAGRNEDHKRMLVQVQQTAGTAESLAVPAGARVQLEDDAKSKLEWMELPAPTQELGAVVTGRIEKENKGDQGIVWHATLAGAQTVEGWPCAAGPIELTAHGRVARCVLGSARKLPGWTAPAGASVYMVYTFSEDEAKSVEAPLGGVIAVPALAMTVPGGYRLDLRKDGSIGKVETDLDVLGGEDASWPKLFFHGMQVQFFLEFFAGEEESGGDDAPTSPLTWVRVDLWGDATCAGHPMGGQLRYNLKGGTVQAYEPDGSMHGPAYPLASCATPLH